MEIITYTNCPGCNSGAIAPGLTAKDHTVTGEQFAIWQCNDCTLRFTQQAPGIDSISRYYQSDNYISHTDTRKGLINTLYHLVRNRTLYGKKALVNKVTGKHHGTLLDIGAGTGAFCGYMKKAGWAVTGLEPDAATRGRAWALHGVTLQPADMLMQVSASFDAVTLWHVLEHVHALHDYMQRIREVLNRDGKAFIAVPNYTSYDARKYKDCWAAYDVPRHLYHFSPASMKQLLTRHGLKLLQVKPMWYDSFYVSMLSEQYSRGEAAYLPAFTTGMLSDIYTMMNKQACSSLIYVTGK